ncbi:MAG: DUF4139 domain-containing protein [Paludibacteraceae bacterium]|nr:DUF4139 domain-containing protein [Paludibacteraceae bacterium]
MTRFHNLYLLLGMLAWALTFSTHANTIDCQSSIQNVTVYKKGAMVERKAHVKLPKGVTEVKLPLLSSKMVQKSLQIGVTNTDITIGNVKIDFEVPDMSTLATSNDTITKRIKQLEDSIQLLNDYNHVLYCESAFIKANNHDIGGKKGYEAAQLAEIASFLRKDLNEIAEKKVIYKDLLNSKTQELASLKQALKLSDENKMNPKGVVYLTLVTSDASETDIDIKYMVDDAEWIPIYEVRIDNLNDPMLVKKKVEIKQNSKEDWNDVALTVTKTFPDNSVEMQELTRYTLPDGPQRPRTKSQKKAEDINMVKVIGVVRDNKGGVGGTLINCSKNGTSTQTDENGFYELLVPPHSDISYTHAGYYNMVKHIEKENVVIKNITLNKDRNKIYSNVKEIEIQAEEDISSLDESKLNKTIASSIDQAMAGRVSGVSITSSSGQPGQGASVRVRGVSSLSGVSEPLYVIDGIPLDGQSHNNLLASINPADIVSMEVLKDASATTIYGSRAANGVFIITTRNAGSNLYNSLQDYTATADGKNTIPADGTKHEAQLFDKEVKANYSFYTAPRENPNVFMLADIPSQKDYDLLEGKVKVYMGNNYIGESYWRPIAIFDTLKFSVGVEKDVAVDRELTTTKKTQMELFNKNKVRRDWKIVVKNNKPISIDLVVEDQIPVSTNDICKVELIDKGGANLDKERGLLKWNLKLAPGERKELHFTFEINYKGDPDDFEDLFDSLVEENF